MFTKIFLSVICLSSIVVAASEPVNLEDVIAGLQADKDKIKTAHIVRVVEKIDNRPSDSLEAERPALVQRNAVYQEELWIDTVRQMARQDECLSDSGCVFTDTNNTGRTIIKDGYEIVSVLKTNKFFLEPLRRLPESIFRTPYIGIINSTMTGTKKLTGDETIGNLRQITLEEPNVGRRLVIDLDPSVNYRCRKTRFLANGVLVNETNLGNYKDVNGILYPHTYLSKSYDANGVLYKEENIYTERAEFNILLPDELFAPISEYDCQIEDSRTGRIKKIKAGEVLSIDG